MVCQTFVEFEGNRKDFRARVILCYIVDVPDKVNREVLDLCQEFERQRVVGINVARSHHQAQAWKIVSIFQEARKQGVHCTVHAGKVGPANLVRVAVEEIHPQLLGHGYHALYDLKVMDLCRQFAIHFETCLTMSLLTGSYRIGTGSYRIGWYGQYPVVCVALADYPDFFMVNISFVYVKLFLQNGVSPRPQWSSWCRGAMRY